MRKKNFTSLHPTRWMKALGMKAVVLSFFAVFLLSAQDAFAQYKPIDEVATILHQELKAAKSSQTATLTTSAVNNTMYYSYVKALVRELDETKNVSTTVDAVYSSFTARLGNNTSPRSVAFETSHQEVLKLIAY